MNVDKLIVGFAGHAGAGKNTAALFLEDNLLHHAPNITQLAFAEPVKRAASVMFNVPLFYFNDTAFKELKVAAWGLSPREMAQLVGTEMARDVIRQDFWIHRMQLEIASLVSKYILITDVRFQNEVDWIVENKGIIVQLRREGADGKVGVANHRSEQLYKVSPDNLYIIENNGTLEQLEVCVDVLYSFLKQHYSLDESTKS